MENASNGGLLMSCALPCREAEACLVLFWSGLS